MTAARITNKIGASMVEALNRRNNDPAHLKAENERLQQENEVLRNRIKTLQNMVVSSHTETIEPTQEWEQLDLRYYQQGRREAGTQKMLAERLHVAQYTVCKWVRDGRLQTVITPDNCESVWLDQGKPSRKKKQKK